MSPVRRSAIGIATRRSTITGTVTASVGIIIRLLKSSDDLARWIASHPSGKSCCRSPAPVRCRINSLPRASAAVGDHATQPDGRPLLTVSRSQNFCGSTSRLLCNSIDAERLATMRPRRARRSHHRAVAGVDDGRGGCRRVPAVPAAVLEQSGGGDQAPQRAAAIYQEDRWRATASRRVRSTSSIAAGCEARCTTQDEIRRGPSPSATSLSTITASVMRCRL